MTLNIFLWIKLLLFFLHKKICRYKWRRGCGGRHRCGRYFAGGSNPIVVLIKQTNNDQTLQKITLSLLSCSTKQRDALLDRSKTGKH
jgi:hypothetical protein